MYHISESLKLTLINLAFSGKTPESVDYRLNLLLENGVISMSELKKIKR